ncbi:MAG: IclR family transcriptional regulator [Streptosporangiaceae bacterium]
MRDTTGSAVTGHDGPAYRLHSVDHALQLLLLFRSKPSLRVSEVADHLNVARSTAHRLLSMLVHRQFAEQDPVTKTYSPGPRLVEIGLAAVGALDLRARLRPFLLDVAAATGETVSLLVLEHDMVHFVDSIESQRTVRVSSRLDARMPAHSTSAGKAILAALTTDEVLAIYPAERLVTLTDQTTMTRSRLLDELALVRATGFATNFEESEIGLGAVGMAVLDTDRRPVAAFTVAGPMQRMNGDYVGQIAAELAPIAAAATADLRHVRRP